MGLGAACLLGLSVRIVLSAGLVHAAPPIIGGLWLCANAASYVYTTRAGKFRVWAELLDGLQLRGDERLLDIGCGRGAVLLMAAQRLPAGRAVGADPWSKTDHSGTAEN